MSASNPTTTPEAAVQRCVSAYYRACEIEDPQNTGLAPASLHRVRLAYRHAMPVLTPDHDSIDTFIACVTHGIIFGVFETSEGSKLLYAAQIAISSHRARLQSVRAQSKSQTQPGPKPEDHPTPLPLAAKPQPAAPQVPKPEQSNSPEPAPSPVTRQDPPHPPVRLQPPPPAPAGNLSGTTKPPAQECTPPPSLSTGTHSL